MVLADSRETFLTTIFGRACLSVRSLIRGVYLFGHSAHQLSRKIPTLATWPSPTFFQNTDPLELSKQLECRGPRHAESHLDCSG
jgi:hypothetical protein